MTINPNLRKGPLSSLNQFLATEDLLKKLKNGFISP